MMARICLLSLLYLLTAADFSLFADEFKYVDEDGTEITTQARLMGAGKGFQALERTDGQIALVPTSAILDRKPTGDPEPMDCDALAARIRELFTAELTRIEIQKPVIVVMVLAAPLDKFAEGHASTFIKKAARFMNNVDGVFQKYAKFMDFPMEDLKYPLVLVIFESDRDFDKYADEASGGTGLSAGAITGFYSGLTNWLAVRMSSCDSFEVPLHEAIHQQMNNRVLKRLAPVPKWFAEGIATGFEGNGERIDSNPAKVNTRYARLSMQLPPGSKWSEIAGNDSSFTADVLAGHAYTLAWCLHWQLATQHKENYQKYVQALSQRDTLQRVSDEEEAKLFKDTFEKEMDVLQKEFFNALQLAAKRQRVPLTGPLPGNAMNQQALGQYNIRVTKLDARGGQLVAEGELRNISPLRAMTFYVTVETDGGMYSDWLVPDLKPTQRIPLSKQAVTKIISGTQPGGSSARYRVYVRSTPGSSPESTAWKSGRVPPPVSAN